MWLVSTLHSCTVQSGEVGLRGNIDTNFDTDIKKDLSTEVFWLYEIQAIWLNQLWGGID